MVGQALQYINTLHKEYADGYISILQLSQDTTGHKVPKTHSYQYSKLEEIIQQYEGQGDTYISVNSFYKPRRQVNNIRQFRALYIDLDVLKDTAYTIDEAYKEVLGLVDSGEIPQPSLVVSSGRGLHLYWVIEHAPKQALTLWQELEDRLYYKLKHLGADSKATDGARVLRLPSTINSRNGEVCSILHIEDIHYKLVDLRDKYFPKVPKIIRQAGAEKGRAKNNITNLFNPYSLHLTRVEDITKLCELRNWNMTGYRNFLIVVYSYWRGIYIRNSEDLLQDVLDFNNKFTEPLSISEVKNVVGTVEHAIKRFIDYEQKLRDGLKMKATKGMKDKGGYWYRNETLIERLKITAEEQKHLKTIISKAEKYRRNNERRKVNRRNEEGLTMREQKKFDNKTAVKQLRSKGLRIKDIAEQLSLSIKTVEHYLYSK